MEAAVVREEQQSRVWVKDEVKRKEVLSPRVKKVAEVEEAKVTEGE